MKLPQVLVPLGAALALGLALVLRVPDPRPDLEAPELELEHQREAPEARIVGPVKDDPDRSGAEPPTLAARIAAIPCHEDESGRPLVENGFYGEWKTEGHPGLFLPRIKTWHRNIVQRTHMAAYHARDLVAASNAIQIHTQPHREPYGAMLARNRQGTSQLKLSSGLERMWEGEHHVYFWRAGADPLWDAIRWVEFDEELSEEQYDAAAARFESIAGVLLEAGQYLEVSESTIEWRATEFAEATPDTVVDIDALRRDERLGLQPWRPTPVDRAAIAAILADPAVTSRQKRYRAVVAAMRAAGVRPSEKSPR